MKIGFGCDHAGIDLKHEMIEYMIEKGYECVDYGTDYDENGEIRTCAAAAEGHEHNLLNLFAASADMARNAVDCSLT